MKQKDYQLPLTPVSNVIVSYTNKLPLIRNDSYLNLVGKDGILIFNTFQCVLGEPHRSNAFYIHDLLPTQRSIQIVNYFSKFGDGGAIVCLHSVLLTLLGEMAGRSYMCGMHWKNV